MLLLLLLLRCCVYASQILPPNARTGMPCRDVQHQCAVAIARDTL